MPDRFFIQDITNIAVDTTATDNDDGYSFYRLYRQYFPPFLSVLVGLCLAIYSGAFLNLQSMEKIKSEAFLLSRDLMREIEGMTENISDIEAFYRSSIYVDEAEFQTFLDVYIDRNKYLEAYYFIPAAMSPVNEFRSLSKNRSIALTPANFEAMSPLFDLAADKRQAMMVTLEPVRTMPIHIRRDYLAVIAHQDGSHTAHKKAKGSGYIVALINKTSLLSNFIDLVAKRDLKVDIELAGNHERDMTPTKIKPRYIENDFFVAGMHWRMFYQSQKLPFIANPIDFFIPFSILLISILIAVYTHLLLLQRHRDEKAKEDLVRAKQIADRANASKSDFLANMSHEIRSPMNSVLGITEMLLKTDMTPEQRSWAKIVHKSGEGLLSIINDILDFSKIEAEKLVLENAPFDLAEAIIDVTDISSLRAQEKNLNLLISIAPSVPKTLNGDRARFRQILLNFITNAIKFTTHGHVLIRATSKRRISGGLELRIDVEDTGIGIPDDKLGYIFEKFSQAEESTTRRFGGTGLGLAICRGLIELMHGTVSVTSMIGRGSVFSFTIPIEAGTQSTLNYQPDIHLEGLKALIVEPYEPAARNLEDAVSASGVKCTRINNMQDVVSMMQRVKTSGESYDFFFIDYDISARSDLKDLEGMLARHQGRKSYIFLTGGVGATSSASLLDQSGITGYLSKPILPSQANVAMKMALVPRTGDLFITRTLIDGILYGATAHTKTGAAFKPSFVGYHVLVVDDMKVNQMIMGKVLEEYGCATEYANTGHEAVMKISKKNYDIVFMDCQMPQMDGFEATRAIRDTNENPYSPIIVALTADAMTGDREKCLNVGMNDYLNKPFKAEQIGAMLKKWLGQ